MKESLISQNISLYYSYPFNKSPKVAIQPFNHKQGDIMDSSWNKLGRAFWNSGIFGTAKALADQNRVPPQADATLPNWKDLLGLQRQRPEVA